VGIFWGYREQDRYGSVCVLVCVRWCVVVLGGGVIIVYFWGKSLWFCIQ
jgi:hypothetical protein